MFKKKCLLIIEAYFFLIFSKNYCDGFVIQKYVNGCKKARAECIIYNLLTQKPLNKNVCFVYTAWTRTVKNTKLNISPNLHEIKKVKNINAFTVYSEDHPEKLIPFFKSRGIRIIFNSAGYNKKHKGIKFITIPYLARNSGNPKEKKYPLFFCRASELQR